MVLGMLSSSRAWRGRSFDSRLGSTLLSAPGLGPATDGHYLPSSVLALCDLQTEQTNLSMIWNEPQCYKEKYKWLFTHRLAKCPLPPSLFSTWILRRCTPLPALTPGHTASVCFCCPASEHAPHTPCTAATQAGVQISCCLFSKNLIQINPFYTESTVTSHIFLSLVTTMRFNNGCPPGHLGICVGI